MSARKITASHIARLTRVHRRERGIGEDAEQPAIDEMGRNQHNILQMGAADIGIVQDPQIAGLEPAIGRITPTTGRLDEIFGMLA